MPESHACLNARASLQEIVSLKKSFDQNYDSALLTKDFSKVARALESKHLLEQKIDALKDLTWPAEIERVFRLREQYEAQLSLLRRTGLVQIKIEDDERGNPQEVLYIKGIDFTEHPVPSFREILKHLESEKDVLRIKIDQGFTKLLLIPFGISLDDMVKALTKTILEYKKRNASAFRAGECTEQASMLIATEYTGADIACNILYEPKVFGANHKGKTKQVVLYEQNSSNVWHKGWRVILLQTEGDSDEIAHVPREQKGIERGSRNRRKDLEAGKNILEYTEELARHGNESSSPYIGESGMTPEDWIVAFMTHLEETGVFLDNGDTAGAASVVGLTGAYAAPSDQALCAYSYTEPTSMVYLQTMVTYTNDINVGIRTVVKI